MNLSTTLTRRESQMITGIVLGKVKKEIASELLISVRTVEATIRNAMIKINVKKSTDLVVYYFVKNFSIPIDALPKSITALVFLILFSGFEFYSSGNALRTSRTRRARTEQVRTRSGRRNEYLIEI